ncbi:MAG TPA: hypothetical protein VMQ60_11535, partial [Acidobacteriaceae bacterium]|nr:hypothetical protein [Acidobacteriaceae bacterium]
MRLQLRTETKPIQESTSRQTLNPTPSIAQSDRSHNTSTGKEAHTMASTEIENLDPAATVDKINKSL